MSISLSAERGERRRVAESTVFSILLALGFSHFLNDMMGSLLPALYPMLKGTYGLSFTQIGVITLTSQLISSVLQPAVGMFADRRPQPYSLAVGMAVTFVGLLLLASAGSYPMLVFAAALVGVGSAVFHPKPRGLHGWRRVVAMAWRNRCSRSAAMSGRRSGPCSQRLS